MERAEQLNDEQALLGESSGNLDAGFYFGVLLFAIRRDQGRLREIAELVEMVAAEDDPTLGSTALWGVTLCELERDVEAAAVLERLALVVGSSGRFGRSLGSGGGGRVEHRPRVEHQVSRSGWVDQVDLMVAELMVVCGSICQFGGG